MKAKLIVAAALMVYALAPAGCDDDDDEVVIPPAVERPDAGTAVDAGQVPATQYVITIQNFRYEPENLSVPPGATVTVTNLDAAPHSVTSQMMVDAFMPGSVNGISFDTGAFSSGSRTFVIPATAAPGSIIPYFCTVHLNAMANDGQITVQ